MFVRLGLLRLLDGLLQVCIGIPRLLGIQCFGLRRLADRVVQLFKLHDKVLWRGCLAEVDGLGVNLVVYGLVLLVECRHGFVYVI